MQREEQRRAQERENELSRELQRKLDIFKAKETEIRKLKGSVKDWVAKLSSRKGRLKKITEEIEEKQSRVRLGVCVYTLGIL